MQKLIDYIKVLVSVELNRANKLHAPVFNTWHEAYAVMVEELEEAEDEIVEFEKLQAEMWECVKADFDDGIETALHSMEHRAINAAAEMIQVAAMCRKARHRREI